METQKLKAEQLECPSKAQVLVFDTHISHQRRSANYKPSIWKYDFLESLNSKYDVRIVQFLFHQLHFHLLASV